MDLTLDYTLGVAYVSDFDRTQWYMYSGQIPDAYIIEFKPAIGEDDFVVAGNRQMNYLPRIVYESTQFESGHTTQAKTIYVQQFLPQTPA